jgi:aldose 1-epimerase
MKKLIYFIGIALLSHVGCTSKKAQDDHAKPPFTVSSGFYGVTQGGDSVALYTFANRKGMEVKITNFGGIVTELRVPDSNGKIEDVVLGFDNLKDYESNDPYFGAIIGRYANRIANGKFTLNGVTYTLASNNDANHLHGGLKGFDKVVWQAGTFVNDSTCGLVLEYVSKDMEEGYPGNLKTTVTYTIYDENEVQIDYLATTDKPTIVNLTQHSYFNLTGNSKRDILDHEVMIKSDQMVPVDDSLIPTGSLMSVAGTPFDFTTMHSVGERIEGDHAQLILGRGYDHCWVLREVDREDPKWVIEAQDASSGRVLALATTEPGVQFYTGNFLDGSLTGKGDVRYEQRYGLCFEPQHFPDSPNQPNFPSVVLNPGEEYRSTTIWRFSTIDQ